ncbi:MAG: tetratricopeptide repeat protein [Clostridia bacterium]|nr:tetratricopeptide repeat protein [Clostridia bacterium]
MRQMFTFLWKTRGNASPTGKPRVYFTCHPADFDRTFEKICTDIFASHDCAIYYTEDMASPIPDENRETDLGRMNLFVIPVTFCLLTQPNRAMDSDFRFAMDRHIPVLPIMMESGIDEVYTRPDKFGEAQYLNPYSSDLTEIGYAQKLKQYLSSVLVSDEMIARVRLAFDAYIFLSYRKKDRRLANELMRLIHSRPELRDIAVWYDEFLTPGESFQENIDRMLRDSKLFTLLVTPNLLEEPNYIMSTEYPAAKRRGMPILPTEMPETIGNGGTDKAILAQKYEGLTDCIPADEEYLQRLLELLTGYARSENDDDPAHNYLIGLAYIDGIDVERDTARGVTLITDAGKAGLPEAIDRLYEMYRNGIAVRLDWEQAGYWAEKLVTVYKDLYGKENEKTLNALHNLAAVLFELADYPKTVQIQEKVYTLCCGTLGAEHPHTLTALSNLATTYSQMGSHYKARDLQEEVCRLRRKVLGEEHPETLLALQNLAVTYGRLGDLKAEAKTEKSVYDQCCRLFGIEHTATLGVLSNLAATYCSLGDYKAARKLQEQAYALHCKVLGEEHPDTLKSQNCLAVTYVELGKLREALDMQTTVCALCRKVLGEDHPDTLTALNNLASIYVCLQKYEKAVKLEEDICERRGRIFGQEHPETLAALNNLASTYLDLNRFEPAKMLLEKVYALQCRTLGQKHPETLTTLHNLAIALSLLREHQQALTKLQEVFDLRCETIGETHPHTLQALRDLVLMSEYAGDNGMASQLRVKLDALRTKADG